MNGFTLKLQDASRSEVFDGVTIFVGEDGSGSFGLLAGHCRMMTSLVIGMARFRVGKEAWQYLAVPGAILYFSDNILSLSTRRYLLDGDYERISRLLQQQLLAEEEKLQHMKKNLFRLEEEVFKRLWKIGQTAG